MQVIEQLRPCSNCSNPFSIDRIDLHEAYCFRNIKKCTQCSAFIDIHEIEAHQEQFHQKKPCSYCKLEYLPDELNIHVGECLRRPKACAYCETDVAAGELSVHEGVCGARTRVCSTCGQPVMLKELGGHQERCRERERQRQRQKQRQRERERDQPPANNFSRPHPPQIPIMNLPDRRNAELPRDLSGNNNVRHHIQYGGQRSLSTNKHNEKNYMSKKPNKDTKYYKVIPMQGMYPRVDILPVSVQLAINNAKRDGREPLRAKNIQV